METFQIGKFVSNTSLIEVERPSDEDLLVPILRESVGHGVLHGVGPRMEFRGRIHPDEERGRTDVNVGKHILPGK